MISCQKILSNGSPHDGWPWNMLRSVFDIIGPPMIGPSSSHTAGAVRIGLLARGLLGENLKTARILLHGSFAATGYGHATDRGLVAGLLGWMPDDDRLKNSLEAASGQNLEIAFENTDLGESVHPNSVRMELNLGMADELVLLASSIGGGSVETVCVDGYEVRFLGTLPTLVIWHVDKSGFLAQVTSLLAYTEANIASIRTARKCRGADALTVIELDSPPEAEIAILLQRIKHVSKLRVLSPLP